MALSVFSPGFESVSLSLIFSSLLIKLTFRIPLTAIDYLSDRHIWVCFSVTLLRKQHSFISRRSVTKRNSRLDYHFI
jgi:hypothetical protein